MIREANKNDLDEILQLYLYLHEKSIPEDSQHLRSTWDNIMNDANCKFLGCILNDYKTFTLNNRNILKNSEDERAVEIYD